MRLGPEVCTVLYVQYVQYLVGSSVDWWLGGRSLMLFLPFSCELGRTIYFIIFDICTALPLNFILDQTHSFFSLWIIVIVLLDISYRPFDSIVSWTLLSLDHIISSSRFKSSECYLYVIFNISHFKTPVVYISLSSLSNSLFLFFLNHHAVGHIVPLNISSLRTYYPECNQERAANGVKQPKFPSWDFRKKLLTLQHLIKVNIGIRSPMTASQFSHLEHGLSSRSKWEPDVRN